MNLTNWLNEFIFTFDKLCAWFFDLLFLVLGLLIYDMYFSFKLICPSGHKRPIGYLYRVWSTLKHVYGNAVECRNITIVISWSFTPMLSLYNSYSLYCLLTTYNSGIWNEAMLFNLFTRSSKISIPLPLHAVNLSHFHQCSLLFFSLAVYYAKHRWWSNPVKPKGTARISASRSSIAVVKNKKRHFELICIDRCAINLTASNCYISNAIGRSWASPAADGIGVLSVYQKNI